MQNRTSLWLVFATLIFLFVLTIHGRAGNPRPSDIQALDKPASPFEISVERGRYLLMLSLLEKQSVSLAPPYADAAYPDLAYWEGKYYTLFTPGLSLVIIPLYLVGSLIGAGQVFSYATISLIALLNIYLIYRVSRGTFNLPAQSARFGAVLFGLGTCAWAYATTLYQHHLVLLCLLAAFFILQRYLAVKQARWLLILSALIGFSTFVDTISGLFYLPVLAYVLYQILSKKVFKRDGVILAAALCAAVLIHLAYNTYHFGSPLRMTGGLPTIDEIMAIQYAFEPFEGAAQRFGYIKNPFTFLIPSNVPTGFFVFLLSFDRGILFYAPLYLLLFYLLFDGGILNSRLARLWLITSIWIFLLYSGWNEPWGGWAFGPRYLIPSFGLAAPFVAYVAWKLASQSSGLFRTILFCTLAGILWYSVVINGVGAITSNVIPPAPAVHIHGIIKSGLFVSFGYLLGNQSASYIYSMVPSSVPLIIYALAVILPASALSLVVTTDLFRKSST